MVAPSEIVPRTSPLRGRRRGRTLVVLGVVTGLILALLWWIGVFGGNVREVVPGRFYRSAQLTGDTLRNALQRNGIQSVINLRGFRREGFYRSETQVCRDLGVAHFDVPLSAVHLPRPADLRTLIADLDRAPKPIMVHCQGGADRAGLVSTLYENVYEGVPLDRAEAEQLTWRYGHFRLGKTRAMDRFFDLYRQTSEGQSLRTWVVRTYPGVYAREELRSSRPRLPSPRDHLTVRVPTVARERGRRKEPLRSPEVAWDSVAGRFEFERWWR